MLLCAVDVFRNRSSLLAGIGQMLGLLSLTGQGAAPQLRVGPEGGFIRRDRVICVLTRKLKQANPQDSTMQADEARNAKEPIAAQIDLFG